jgi:uncharacterized protein (TIGR01244 family)
MTNLPISFVTADIAVAPQMQPEQMAALAAQGFRSVINHRMPHEPGQPAQEALRDAAAQAGLRYEWQPVNPAMITADDVKRFAALLDELPRPLLAFCRSGSRSTALVQAAARQRQER